MLLRARIVVPISGPPLEDAAVWVRGNRILRVGRWKEMPRPAGVRWADLGEVALLPGLINAHAHLDLTRLVERMPPASSFVEWLQNVLAARKTKEDSDFAAGWMAGADEQLRYGSTSLVNIESTPGIWPRVRSSTPLRVFSLREMTGVLSGCPPEEILDEACREISAAPEGPGGVGLAPHAPYSTSARLLALCGERARAEGRPVGIHVAESESEVEMFLHRRGELFDWLKPYREMSDCGLGTPIRHLERSGLLKARVLAVHANHLRFDDPEILARHQVAVAHCPQTHAFFRRAPFPWDRLHRARVNVALGTDSVLTTGDPHTGRPGRLNLFDEMQQLRASFPQATPEEILRTATLNPAKALGWGDRLGHLAEGSLADLVAIPYSGLLQGALEAILHHKGPVAGSMIDGSWRLLPPQARSLLSEPEE